MEIETCDFKNPLHQQQVLFLLDNYMQDPMGGGNPMPVTVRNNLLKGLTDHPTVFMLFAKHKEKYVGLITCFVNFSTFKAKPYINIHDIIVLKPYRGQGIGHYLIQQVIQIAQEREYCKVTLEVREDNAEAKKLYRRLEFFECNPPMYYWEHIIR